MIEIVADIGPDALARHSAVIDVRTPAEFADDHIPGAINLPVLSNEERAEVGTIYVQESRFRARRVGAAHVARNVAGHLEAALAGRDAKFRPLLYCWRGGMRSNAMATILSQVGWRVGVVEGGYRTWRRAVVSALDTEAGQLPLVLIDGETGSAKTDILRRLASIGIQTIDLEGVAAHKGSVFGGDAARAQPTQKQFESQLFDRLRALDLAAPIAVEAESSRIGRLIAPKRLWASMRAAPRLSIRAPMAARARYLAAAYGDLLSAPGAIAASIERLRPFHPKERIEGWLALAAAGGVADLAEALMREHYDPLYQRSKSRNDCRRLGVIDLDDLQADDIERAAAQAADIIARAFG